MEAIRTTQTVADGIIQLQLPKQFWGKEVEIIVLSSSEQHEKTPVRKKSLRGSLKRYADPALRIQEEAWQVAGFMLSKFQ